MFRHQACEKPLALAALVVGRRPHPPIQTIPPGRTQRTHAFLSQLPDAKVERLRLSFRDREWRCTATQRIEKGWILPITRDFVRDGGDEVTAGGERRDLEGACGLDTNAAKSARVDPHA